MKRHKGNRWQGVLLGTFLGVSSLFAQQGQTGYQPTPENLQARQEFSDSKFGIFLHWGIYSMFGQGEWYMETSGIDFDQEASMEQKKREGYF
jgi:alpha-L-fucosidase